MAKVTRTQLNRASKRVAKKMDRLFKAQSGSGCVNLSRGELSALALYAKEIQKARAEVNRSGFVDSTMLDGVPSVLLKPAFANIFTR